MEGTPKNFGCTTSCDWGFLYRFEIRDLRLEYLLFNPKLLSANTQLFALFLMRTSFHRREVKAVKIKPMLARLQSAIGRDDLVEQMVLLPEPQKPFSQPDKPENSVNLIVAYNGSPKSHTALDLAFWIAHQTRLATNTQVTVQAVYVVEENYTRDYPEIFNSAKHLPTLDCPASNVSKSLITVRTQSKLSTITPHLQEKLLAPLQKADKIIWQARSLAEEWQGSFQSHLRFGNVAAEVKKVVELEAADILFVGCRSFHHRMIKALGADFPCAVLGIPNFVEQ